jgi:hypothetical protein
MTTIISKYGTGAPPENAAIETGEIAIDIQNHVIYTRDGNNQIVKLGDGEALSKVEWSAILNKPDTFPPSKHTHDQSDIDGLEETINNININIGEIESEIGAIATTLAFGGSFSASTGKIIKGAKEGVVAGQDIPDASTLENTFLICAQAGSTPEEMKEGDWLVSDGSKWVAITYSSGSAGSVAWDNVQGKPDFDALYAPISHDHEIDDINGLQDALDALPQPDHGHEISDIDGLQDELDGKASLSRITGGTY